MNPRRRLQRRILAVLACLTLAVAAVFSLYTVVFTYEVEDALLNAQLQEEAGYQHLQHAATGDWATPRDPRMQLHRSVRTLPPEVATLLRDEPRRIEFPGSEGRHYHLAPLLQGGDSAWLLYDVGDRLVVNAMRDGILWLLAWTTLLFVAVALGAGQAVVRRLTRRLERLADDVDRLDPARLPASADPAAVDDDEVGVLARGIDALTTRLRAVVERERSFTRDASHELRTPLAVIRAAGDQLVTQHGLAPVPRKLAELVRESTARLEQTVEMLLVLAREEHGPAVADMSTRVLPLLEQAVLDQSPQLEGKVVDVQVDVPADACLQAPPAVVRILLANLVGNAFAHTLSGTVRIGVERGWLCIRNPSVSTDWPAHATDAFRKGADSEGFGLGLVIVHRLCARFGVDLMMNADATDAVAMLRLHGADASTRAGAGV